MRITKLDRHMARLVYEHNFLPTKPREEIFYNLCFCICAPQSTFKGNLEAERGLRLIDFYKIKVSEDILWPILKPVRFYRQKAARLINAKQSFPDILRMLSTIFNQFERREWLVNNVDGLGYKAASHFLRNLGETDLAIIDTHVLKFLGISGKWNYLEVENQFRKIAKKRGLTVAELDIIVWKHYSGTPWENYRF